MNFSICAAGAEDDPDTRAQGQWDDSQQEQPIGDNDNLVADRHAQPGAPDESERDKIKGQSQQSGDCDAVMGNVLGSALTYQLRQLETYEALSMHKLPNFIPVFEADHWLKSWQVVAGS